MEKIKAAPPTPTLYSLSDSELTEAVAEWACRKLNMMPGTFDTNLRMDVVNLDARDLGSPVDSSSGTVQSPHMMPTSRQVIVITLGVAPTGMVPKATLGYRKQAQLVDIALSKMSASRTLP